MVLHLTGKIDCLGYVGDGEAIYRKDIYKIGDFVKHSSRPDYDGFVEYVVNKPESMWITRNHVQSITVKTLNGSVIVDGSMYEPIERKENE